MHSQKNLNFPILKLERHKLKHLKERFHFRMRNKIKEKLRLKMKASQASHREKSNKVHVGKRRKF